MIAKSILNIDEEKLINSKSNIDNDLDTSQHKLEYLESVKSSLDLVSRTESKLYESPKQRVILDSPLKIIKFCLKSLRKRPN
jgi:deoxyinosine 3'endonuclease (endonuclease V)